MFLSGIADEAADSIDGQIAAHKELGWDHIEIRNIGRKNLTDVDDAVFDAVEKKLGEAKMKVVCFASQIANWSRKITGDFSVDVEELKRAIPRMKRLGTRYIRIMSYPNDNCTDAFWRKEVIKRIKELVRIAEDGGVVLAHENCSGWGGMNAEEALDLTESVNSPAFKWILDTGNKPHRSGTIYDIYKKVRGYVEHVHIKDYKGEKGDQFVFPGEGEGEVKKILKELIASGYNGGFSIEPHMAAVAHTGKEAEDKMAAYKLYIEYGRRAEKLLKEISL